MERLWLLMVCFFRMFDFKAYFKDRKNVLVLDGGFSTQLSNHVADRVDGNPLWCSFFLHTDPEAVRKTHLDYLRAGADVIITNTYQASVGGFREYLHIGEDDGWRLMESAVTEARNALEIFLSENERIIGPFVAGSIGPYGAALHNGSEYTGSYVNHVSLKEMEEWHRPRIEALIGSGVDLLAIETMPASPEVEMLVTFLKANFPTVKFWISFSCKDERHTNFGEDFQEVARRCYELNPSQIIAVGVNCTNPKYVEKLLDGFNKGGQAVPLIVYPNSGENYHPKRG